MFSIPQLVEGDWHKDLSSNRGVQGGQCQSVDLQFYISRLSTVGDRAFPVIGSRFWNTLPDSVTSAPSFSVFRSRLKSHLFERSFPADSY